MPSVVRGISMADKSKRVHRFLLNQDIHLYKIGDAVPRVFVIQRGIPARRRFYFIVKIKDKLRQRKIIDEADALRCDVIHSHITAAFFLTELHRSPNVRIG